MQITSWEFQCDNICSKKKQTLDLEGIYIYCVLLAGHDNVWNCKDIGTGTSIKALRIMRVFDAQNLLDLDIVKLKTFSKVSDVPTKYWKK